MDGVVGKHGDHLTNTTAHCTDLFVGLLVA